MNYFLRKKSLAYFFVILLSLLQVTLIPVGLALPFFVYISVYWQKSTLLINLLIGSFLIDILGNLPLGITMAGFASVLIIFSLVNEFFKFNRIQIILLSMLTPFLLELLLKFYLTLLL